MSKKKPQHRPAHELNRRPSGERFKWLRWTLPATLGWAIVAAVAYAVQAQTVQAGWWEEFSLARFFDSPVLFVTVMGLTGLFVLFYIVLAVQASALERAAASWAGSRGLAELVEALHTSAAQLAFVRVRYLRSERLYSQLLKQLPTQDAKEETQILLADLPDNDQTQELGKELLSSELGKKARREALAKVFEQRDERLQRLLMACLKQVKEGKSVGVHVIYLLEDLAASDARPLLERLLSSGSLPERIVRNALRRIPKAQQAKAK